MLGPVLDVTPRLRSNRAICGSLPAARDRAARDGSATGHLAALGADDEAGGLLLGAAATSRLRLARRQSGELRAPRGLAAKRRPLDPRVPAIGDLLGRRRGLAGRLLAAERPDLDTPAGRRRRRNACRRGDHAGDAGSLSGTGGMVIVAAWALAIRLGARLLATTMQRRPPGTSSCSKLCSSSAAMW